jgi:hypothetical protein
MAADAIAEGPGDGQRIAVGIKLPEPSNVTGWLTIPD